MKKILFLLLAVFLVVGCYKENHITGPNGDGNDNDNIDNSTAYSNVVPDYGWVHQWSKPIFIRKATLGNGTVQCFYKVSLNACPINPTGFHLSDFFTARVNKSGVTTYWNAPGEARFEKQGFIGGTLYFYIISSPNQVLKYNFSVFAIFNSSTGVVSDPGEWFLFIPIDDGINNMDQITT